MAHSTSKTPLEREDTSRCGDTCSTASSNADTLYRCTHPRSASWGRMCSRTLSPYTMRNSSCGSALRTIDNTAGDNTGTNLCSGDSFESPLVVGRRLYVAFIGVSCLTAAVATTGGGRLLTRSILILRHHVVRWCGQQTGRRVGRFEVT